MGNFNYILNLSSRRFDYTNMMFLLAGNLGLYTMTDNNYDWVYQPSSCTWTMVRFYSASQWRIASGNNIWRKPSTWTGVGAIQKITNIEDTSMPCSQWGSDNRHLYNFTILVRTSNQCNGISEFNPNVCNGRGSCIADEVCNCTGNYTGYNCAYTLCPSKYLHHICLLF
jgi:hypothetical protein